MKITKFGHCCLLIEENGVRILTDPGNFTVDQNAQKNIDILLITHEHEDHFHVDSVKLLVANNPNMVVVTNKSVGKLLDEKGIKYEVVAEGQTATHKNILLEGYGHKHAIIYDDFGQVENTGYFINNKLFYPGDAFTNPGKAVDVLAVPAGGPWMKVSEAIEYAKSIHPNSCFPVHDGMFQPTVNFNVYILNAFLTKAGIKFVSIALDKETEF